MRNDQTAKSWNHLQELLYDIPIDRHDRYRSNFVYRGVDDATWGLETSLQRLGAHFAAVEGPLLRNFLKYAKPGDVSSDTLFFKLALAQHHGLPTRVLDWTTAPKVALHFATSNEKLFDTDGVIWCVDVVAVRSLLPAKLQATLEAERAFVFSLEMLADYQTLPEFDRLAAEAVFPLFFEPPSLDERIVNQAAMLSIMPDPALDLKALLRQRAHRTLFRRIVIPKQIKRMVRDKLDQDNITERMLFPGLDGTSRWLKRYYGTI